jgi:hypothetical protein
MVPDTPGKIGIFVDQAFLPGPRRRLRGLNAEKTAWLRHRAVSGKTGIHGTGEGEMEAQQRALWKGFQLKAQRARFHSSRHCEEPTGRALAQPVGSQ